MTWSGLDTNADGAREYAALNAPGNRQAVRRRQGKQEGMKMNVQVVGQDGIIKSCFSIKNKSEGRVQVLEGE